MNSTLILFRRAVHEAAAKAISAWLWNLLQQCNYFFYYTAYMAFKDSLSIAIEASKKTRDNTPTQVEYMITKDSGKSNKNFWQMYTVMIQK